MKNELHELTGSYKLIDATLELCAAVCFADVRCNSFNYDTVNARCGLNEKTSAEDASSYTTSSDQDYYEKQRSRHMNGKANACEQRRCKSSNW